MKITGHTPLARMDNVPVQQQTLLFSLWVESVEEFVSVMAAMAAADDSADASTLAMLRTSEATLLEGIAENTLMPWRQPASAAALGCRFDPQVLATVRDQGRVSLPGSVAPQLSDAALPPSVRLMDKTFPVRNQGERPTCVAFASVALREYVDRCTTELSEQFLYWACKQMDGYPDEPGTFVSTAMSALSTKGVCPREAWPYHPETVPGNESQGPPPEGAEVASREFIMLYTRSVAPGSVNHYKQVLSGVDGLGGMPIVIGSLVFNSWLRSPATRQSGKITMPLPGELPLSGGHAMLVVGYQDDPSVPGGGYFILRNSWSDRWASNSPEAPGHAMMPYAYVQQYIVEAFSGQVMAASADDANKRVERVGRAGDDAVTFEQRYVRTSREGTRDVEGKLLRAGIRIICHPDAANEVMEDTPENRARFEEQQFAWSESAREKAWLPPRVDWPGNFRQSVQHAYRCCQNFCDAIDENVNSAIGKPVPDANLPLWSYALAWMPKVRNARKVADLTDNLSRQLCRVGDLPDEINLPAAWRETLAGMNRLAVYSVESRLGRFHVASAFVSPLQFTRDGDVAFVPPTAEVADAVQIVYREWIAEQTAAGFTFFTIGAAERWQEDMCGSSSHQHCSLLSSHDDVGRWLTSAPPRFASRRYLRDFLDRLYPETHQQRISRIKEAVDQYVASGYEGNILLDKIARETGYRRTTVMDAFRAMRSSGHYECYRVDKKIAIRNSTGRRGIRLPSDRSAFLHYHLGLAGGVLLGILGWKVASYVTTGVFDGLGLLLLFPFTYAGRCVEMAVRRSQSNP